MSDFDEYPPLRYGSDLDEPEAEDGRPAWRRPAILALIGTVILVLVAVVGVVLVSCENDQPPPPPSAQPRFVSYAAAASRLRGLESLERDEQLRDWTRIGLASLLKLETPELLHALYDTMPVRDAAFADLARQSTGPGRALYDGRGVLHTLVPKDDPHQARTVGLLVDQYRADAGTDPTSVQIHHYRFHPEAELVELTSEEPIPTDKARLAHGYVTMRVDDAKGLADFLAQTRHLSWLEVRGAEIWAGGWRWPDVPAAPLDMEDVSVLQRGYLQLASDGGSGPGFSLDPGPQATPADVLAALPGLRPDLADAVAAGDQDISTLVDNALFHEDVTAEELSRVGLPTDRTQLWGVRSLLDGRPLYSQARYDGGLAGTKVGMTLFYTDHMAKDWVVGVGDGVPPEATGFVPDPKAATPWSHCPGREDRQGESGRLWFGQNDAGFAFEQNRVAIGAEATRLFARSDAADGTEVEPSFRFGRGLRWWDQHYQAVADYEPQYQRLDQIMRWSGAMDWLLAKTSARLPQLPDAQVQSDLRFRDWYAGNSDLKERSSVAVVTPPSAEQREAVLAKPSKTYQDCGLLVVQGGVSLADFHHRAGDTSFHADLPAAVRRAGPVDAASTYDPATGSGSITQVTVGLVGNVTKVIDHVHRRLSRLADGRARVEGDAGGRAVVSAGDVMVLVDKDQPRRYTAELAAEQGQVSHRLAVDDVEQGELVARPDSVLVSLQWRSGVRDLVVRALESIQERLVRSPTGGLPSPTDGVLGSFQDSAGQTLYPLGGKDDPALLVTTEHGPPGARGPPAPPGSGPAFRLGDPHEPDRWYRATLVQADAPDSGNGPTAWASVTPATRSAAALFTATHGPDSSYRPIEVRTPDQQSTTVYWNGERSLARAGDPVLSTAEGRALRSTFPRVDKAMREAAQAEDHLLRGVPLSPEGTQGPEGVALVDAGTVTVVAAGHPWAAKVLQALGPDPAATPLVRLDDGHAVIVDTSPHTVAPDSSVKPLSEGLLAEPPDTAVYASPRLRSLLGLTQGSIVLGALPHDPRVTIRRATLATTAATGSPSIAPDVHIYRGIEWKRVSGTGLRVNPPRTGPYPGPADTGATAPATGPGAVAPGWPIILVCPEDDSAECAA